MRKALRKILRLAAVVGALLILAIVAVILFFLFDKRHVKSILETQLAKRTGLTVRAGRLDYSLFPFRLTIEALELGLENDTEKLDVTLERLEAKGDFWKIMSRTRPAIDTIEAEGAVFRFRQKAPSGKTPDRDGIVRRAADAIAWARRISVAKASLNASLLSLEANSDEMNFSLVPKDGGSDTAYSLSCSELDVTDKGKAYSLRGGLMSSGTLRLAPSPVIDAIFSLVAAQVNLSGIKESLTGIDIEAAGRVDMAAKEVTVSQFRIGIPDLFEVQGTGGGRYGQDIRLAAEATAKFDKLENVTALLRPQLPAEFSRSQVRGRAALSGKYLFQRSDQGKTDNLDGSLAFEGVELDHVLDGLPLHVRASGRVQASGPSRVPQFSADVRLSWGGVATGKLNAGKSDAHIVASGTKEHLTINQLEAELTDLSSEGRGGKRLTVEKATLTGKVDLNLTREKLTLNSLGARFDAVLKDLSFAADGKSLSFDAITLKGEGGLDLDRKTTVLNSLEVRFPGFPPILAGGQFGLGKTPAAHVRLETSGLDIASVRTLAAPFIPETFAGWELGGTADLSLGFSRPAASGPGWRIHGVLSLAQAKLNDPSFTVASEGIGSSLKFEGEYSVLRGLSFTGDLGIGQGESLWKAVYVSWNKNPLTMSVAGRYTPGSAGLDDLSARFLLPPIGEITLSGSLTACSSPLFDLRSDVRLSLGPLYSLYTQAGVTEQNRMHLEGMLKAGLHIKKERGGLSVSGRLTFADTSFERELTRTALLKVDAEVPIHYESGKPAMDPPESPLPEQGFLRIGEFRNPYMTLKSLDISLRAGTNTFTIEPFTFELYGGRLELGRTAVRIDPKTGFLQGTGSLALRDLDISRFPIRSPQFKLTGGVQADFPRFDMSPKEVAVSGRGEADIFGGKVILRDISISQPFSPGRSVSLNLDLLDLDLKKLTDEVPFGEVTGIVRGEVRNLVITYRQPERFEFRIESVPRKGVPQTFSLKAVDNLTVLSSGAQATAGRNRFWIRFIRGFRYEKLGIVSTLRNDTFTFNGTIHEGGVEYLVKKPALFGINVINRMPEKLISFKEMTSRLKRVGQSEK